MIDSVRMFGGLDMYHLSPVPGKWHRDISTDPATGEIQGERSYCNLPFSQMTVKSDGILRIQASAPKLLRGSSLEEVTDADRDKFTAALAKQARSVGLETDPAALRVWWVDYCKNMEMKRHTRDYLSLLQQYSIPRRTKRSFDGETVTFANKSRQLCCYDKLAEVRAAAVDTEDRELLNRVDSDPRRNLLRVESRLMRTKPISRVTGVEMPHLVDIWHSDLSREVLLADFDSVTEGSQVLPPIDFNNLVMTLSEYREMFPRGGAFRLVEADGLRHLLSACRGDWELLKGALGEAGYCHRSVRRIISRWRETFRATVPEDSAGLIQEVRTKLAA